jgi:hypothetical protein
MHYKSIVLEILEERPRLMEQLRSQRTAPAALNHYAGLLKTSHEVWMESLSRAKPNSDPSQIASEALEIALKELEDRLPAESPPDEAEPLTLDGAMAFLLRRTRPD